MNHAQFWGGGGAAPYEIEQSLRFDGSASLSRSLGTTSSSWTVSFWTKTALNDNNDGYWFSTSQTAIYMDTSSGAASDRRWKIRDNSTGTLVVSNALVRDPSAWYHVVYKCDGSNRRLYINNSLDAGFTFSGSTTLSGSSLIGGYYTGSGAKIEAYIAEFHLVDGTALNPTDFGEYDDNGVWRPIAYSGSYGTNGFYLKFDPSATNGIGHDHSGNGNNWSPTGFVTSGTGTDVFSDTPTTNYPTINPLTNISGLSGTISSITEGNLKSNSNGNTMLPTTIAIPAGTGKWYWEATINTQVASSNWQWGVQRADVSRANYVSFIDTKNNSVLVNPNNLNNTVIYGSSSTTTAWTVAASDVLGVALDASTGDLAFYKNGTLQVTLSGAVNTSYPHYPAGSGYSGTDVATWNFGQRAFEQTVPTGYKALNTSNLPAPDIAKGSDYFNTVLYTGTGTTNPRTDVGFQPDLTWIKIRSAASNHAWYDAIRGSTKVMGSSSTSAETTDGSVTPTSSGFTLGSENTSFGSTNGTGETYVAWNWLGANGTSTPSGGSIASTVSANPSAGFSIVSYVGTFAAETIAHGLGNAPNMIITKSRDTADRWQVYHSALGNGYTLRLEADTAAGADSGAWNSTSPTSNVFSVGASVRTNRSGDDFIAYCFAEVEGYSKFGSYIGNGSTDGPFVYCGFRPAWVMIKRTSSTGSWYIGDNTRNTYNVMNARLLANSSGAESSTLDFWDFTSNGFKLRTSSSEYNSSGQTFIFMAFAEHPFGGSGVSPATAR